MSKTEGRNTFWCNACNLKFAAYTARKISHPFCTKCGECADSVKYEDREKKYEDVIRVNKTWTTQEKARFLEDMKKGKSAADLMAKYDRTSRSIRHQAYRMGYRMERMDGVWTWRQRPTKLL